MYACACLNDCVHGFFFLTKLLQVKLTFQVPKIIGPTSCSSSSNINGVSRQPAYYNLCARVTGCDIHAIQQQLLQHLCAAMYLTLPSSDNETSAQVSVAAGMQMHIGT